MKLIEFVNLNGVIIYTPCFACGVLKNLEGGVVLGSKLLEGLSDWGMDS